jgi:hypothetical protein
MSIKRTPPRLLDAHERRIKQLSNVGEGTIQQDLEQLQDGMNTMCQGSYCGTNVLISPSAQAGGGTSGQGKERTAKGLSSDLVGQGLRLHEGWPLEGVGRGVPRWLHPPWGRGEIARAPSRPGRYCQEPGISGWRRPVAMMMTTTTMTMIRS